MLWSTLVAPAGRSPRADSAWSPFHEEALGLGRRVIWTVGVDGTERRVPAPEQEYFVPRISPDGQRVVVENNVENACDPTGPLILFDLRTGAAQRLAAPGEGVSPE